LADGLSVNLNKSEKLVVFAPKNYIFDANILKITH